MSLNCKQLKQKYEELLQKKAKFILDYQRLKNSGEYETLKIVKLEFEKKTKEIRELLKYPGSIVDHLKKISRENNIKIAGFKNIHILTDGTISGFFHTEGRSSSDYIFVNDEIIDLHDFIEFMDVVEFLIKDNGNVILLVNNYMGEEELWLGNISTREFHKQQESIDIQDLRLQVDGSVSWKAGAETGSSPAYVPFVDNKKIEKIAGSRVFSNLEYFHKREDGKWVGSVVIGDKRVLFIDDTVIEKMEGEDILGIEDLHTQPNGDLAGRVNLGGKWYPFQGGRVLREIAGRSILSTFYVTTTPEGLLTGYLSVWSNEDSPDEADKWEKVLFRGDEVITEISGEKVCPVTEIKCDSKGQFCGHFYLGGVSKLFQGNHVFDTISGKKIIKISRDVDLLEDDSISGYANVEGMNRRDTSLFVFDGEKYVFLSDLYN